FEDQLTDTTPVTSVSAAEGVANTNVVLMTFTDGNLSAVAGDFTPVVDWGGALAGLSPVVTVVAHGAGSWKGVANSVAYAEKGTHTVGVTVHDGNADAARTNKVRFAVADAPLTDTTSIVANATEGIASTNVVVMTFTDANPFSTASDFSVGSVNWGGTLEGTPPSLTIVADSSYSGPGSGWKVVASSVTYDQVGSFTVSLTVNDVDGSTVSTSHVLFDVASGTSTSVVLTLSAPSVTYGQDGHVTVTVAPAGAAGTLSLFLDNNPNPVGTQILDPATGDGSAAFDVGILA